MWMRVLGAAATVIACTALGAGAVLRMRERKCLLERMRRMIVHLRGEIMYANVTLETAFWRTGKREEGKLSELFCSVARRLENEAGENFAEMWREEAETILKDTSLKRQDMEQLVCFGKSLGYLDRDMQERVIRFYLEDLELAIENIRREEPEKSRLFFGLGILSGLFLTVILL